MKRAVTVVLLGLCLASYPSAFAQTPPPVIPCVTPCPPPPPRPPDAARGLETKYARDSAEYASLCRQVYRMATNAVTGAAHAGTWGVILDIDETTLDNSAYQLERSAYGLSYDDASWAAWVVRKEAGSVPGVEGFVNAVRNAGGNSAERPRPELRGAFVFTTETQRTQSGTENSLKEWFFSVPLCALCASVVNPRARIAMSVIVGCGSAALCLCGESERASKLRARSLGRILCAPRR